MKKSMEAIICKWSGKVQGNGKNLFADYNNIPREHRKYITYERIVVGYHSQKEDPNRTWLTVGENLIEYPWYVSPPTTDTTTSKIVWNSVISTPKSKYMCIELKCIYLDTPRTRYEYIYISNISIPDKIVKR